MAALSEKQVQALMRLVRRQLAPMLAGPEYDDRLGEAYYGMWKRLAHPPPGVKLTTVAIHGARWALADYLRSHRQLVPRDRFGRGLGEIYSLDATVELEGAEDGYSPWQVCFREPQTPDFVPALIEQIGSSDLLEELCAGCTPHQARVVRRWVGGETLESIAADFEIHKETARQLLARAFSDYRTGHGLPDRGEATTGKKGGGERCTATKHRKRVTSSTVPKTCIS